MIFIFTLFIKNLPCLKPINLKKEKEPKLTASYLAISQKPDGTLFWDGGEKKEQN